MAGQLEKDKEGGGREPGSQKEKDQVGGTLSTSCGCWWWWGGCIPWIISGSLRRDTAGIEEPFLGLEDFTDFNFLYVFFSHSASSKLGLQKNRWKSSV